MPSFFDQDEKNRIINSVYGKSGPVCMDGHDECVKRIRELEDELREMTAAYEIVLEENDELREREQVLGRALAYEKQNGPGTLRLNEICLADDRSLADGLRAVAG